MLYQFLIIDVDVGVDTTMAEVVAVEMVAIILGIVIAMVHPKKKKKMVPITKEVFWQSNMATYVTSLFVLPFSFFGALLS